MRKSLDGLPTTQIKKFIYFFVVLISINGVRCTSTHLISQKTMYKSIYIDQFKLTYFRYFLIKGYNNSKAIHEIIQSDHSGFTEPILTEKDYTLIDSLTISDNEKMKTDSTEGDQRAEGAQGKRPLGYIIERLNSKWLDSIAKRRYKSSGVNTLYSD